MNLTVIRCVSGTGVICRRGEWPFAPTSSGLFRVVGANGHSPLRKYVESKIGDFPRNINRLPTIGAKTWHFYYKDGKWCVAVSFTPSTVERVSRSVDYGCIGIDMNPLSIGWAYIDAVGNLKAHGQIPLQTGLPKGKQQAQIVKA